MSLYEPSIGDSSQVFFPVAMRQPPPHPPEPRQAAPSDGCDSVSFGWINYRHESVLNTCWRLVISHTMNKVLVFATNTSRPKQLPSESRSHHARAARARHGRHTRRPLLCGSGSDSTARLGQSRRGAVPRQLARPPPRRHTSAARVRVSATQGATAAVTPGPRASHWRCRWRWRVAATESGSARQACGLRATALRSTATIAMRGSRFVHGGLVQPRECPRAGVEPLLGGTLVECLHAQRPQLRRHLLEVDARDQPRQHQPDQLGARRVAYAGHLDLRPRHAQPLREPPQLDGGERGQRLVERGGGCLDVPPAGRAECCIGDGGDLCAARARAARTVSSVARARAASSRRAASVCQVGGCGCVCCGGCSVAAAAAPSDKMAPVSSAGMSLAGAWSVLGAVALVRRGWDDAVAAVAGAVVVVAAVGCCSRAIAAAECISKA